MIINTVLLLLLITCVVTDLKSRKIYNIVLFPTILVGFILNGIFDGFSGLTTSLAGLGVGLGLLLIPYLLGGMGAGDVKLLATIGALKGTFFVLTTALYMALLGGVIALAIFLFRKGVYQRVKSMIITFSSYRSGVKIPLALDKEALKTTYPYGVAIAGGAIVTLFAKGVILPW